MQGCGYRHSVSVGQFFLLFSDDVLMKCWMYQFVQTIEDIILFRSPRPRAAKVLSGI